MRISELIFDREFCQFLLKHVQFYQQHDTNRASDLLELMFECVSDGDILSEVSIYMLSIKQVADEDKGEYFKKGIQMAKSAESIQNMIRLIKKQKGQNQQIQQHHE